MARDFQDGGKMTGEKYPKLSLHWINGPYLCLWLSGDFSLIHLHLGGPCPGYFLKFTLEIIGHGFTMQWWFS